MIADSKIKGSLSPGLDLIFDKVIPRLFLIIGEVSRFSFTALFFNEVLVRTVNGAQVS